MDTKIANDQMVLLTAERDKKKAELDILTNDLSNLNAKIEKLGTYIEVDAKGESYFNL